MTSAANIGPRECRKRLSWGVGVLIASGIYLILILLFHLGEFWWLPLFFTTFVGSLGILQALEKTCVVLAAGGMQIMDNTGVAQKVSDNELSRKLRRKGNRVMVKTVILTLIFSGFCYLILKTQSQ